MRDRRQPNDADHRRVPTGWLTRNTKPAASHKCPLRGGDRVRVTSYQPAYVRLSVPNLTPAQALNAWNYVLHLAAGAQPITDDALRLAANKAASNVQSAQGGLTVLVDPALIPGPTLEPNDTRESYNAKCRRTGRLDCMYPDDESWPLRVVS